MLAALKRQVPFFTPIFCYFIRVLKNTISCKIVILYLHMISFFVLFSKTAPPPAFPHIFSPFFSSMKRKLINNNSGTLGGRGSDLTCRDDWCLAVRALALIRSARRTDHVMIAGR